MKNKKGVLLIVGGLVIAGMTLGGFYLSKNPELISQWKYQRDSKRKEQSAQVTLVAPSIS